MAIYEILRFYFENGCQKNARSHVSYIMQGLARGLCAYRGPEFLTTVFGYFKGVEQDVGGGIILNYCEHCQNKFFLENGCR